MIHQLISFAIAAFFIVIIPGPNMAFLISCAATQGRKTAVFGLLGSNTALLSLAFLTGIGLSTLLRSVAAIYYILKIAGALYLFWLAYKNIMHKKRDDRETEARDIYSNAKAFRTGYFTNVLNPKAAIFYVAIFPAFLNPNVGHIVLQAILLGLAHVMVSIIVNLLVISSVSKITQRYNLGGKAAIIKKWAAAAVFTAFGIKILLQN